MNWQTIDLSNDVSFIKIVRVVCDYRPERQYSINTPRMVNAYKNFFLKVNGYCIDPSDSSHFEQPQCSLYTDVR